MSVDTQEIIVKLQNFSDATQQRILSFIDDCKNLEDGKPFNVANVKLVVREMMAKAKISYQTHKDKAVSALQAAWGFVKSLAELVWAGIQSFWNYLSGET